MARLFTARSAGSKRVAPDAGLRDGAEDADGDTGALYQQQAAS
jgi:hypothetical protein